jgi:alkanesulfonate monooxygenase SsuD/methylene tetrahydromethanopterin reductase-like flavin-dependent oxidoreductase (luciferase family)
VPGSATCGSAAAEQREDGHVATGLVEFGLAIDFGSERDPLAARLARVAQLLKEAEQYGFQSVWAGESYPTHGTSSHLPAPFLVLAALAPRTSLRLGTGITMLTAWNPLRLAYDAAILDQLSGGRLILGVAGGHRQVWSRFGVPPERLGERLDETIRALRALWSGGEGYHGEFVDVAGGIYPQPLQPLGPPVWVGGLAARSARRAAEFGDGWYASTAYRLDTEIRLQVTRYGEALRQFGSRRGAVAVNRLTVLAETDSDALRSGGPYVEHVLRRYIDGNVLHDRHGHPIGTGQSPLSEELRREFLLVGSPLRACPDTQVGCS